MSRARLIQYRHRLGGILTVLCLILLLLMLFVGMAAAAQGVELAGGVQVAKEMAGKSLAEGALITAGICVAALCYVVRVAYQMHVEQIKTTITFLESQKVVAVNATQALDNAAKQLEALTAELRSRPCIGLQPSHDRANLGVRVI